MCKRYHIVMMLIILGLSSSFFLIHWGSIPHFLQKQPAPVFEVSAVPVERKTNTETLVAMGGVRDLGNHRSQAATVDFTIPKKFRQQIKEKQFFTAILNADDKKVFSGHISSIHPRVSEATGALTVSGVLNQNRYLMPGTAVKIILPLETRQVLTIPKKALRRFGKEKYIFIFDSQTQQALKISVKIISLVDDKVNIQANIPDDVLVITNGVDLLNHRQHVSLKISKDVAF